MEVDGDGSGEYANFAGSDFLCLKIGFGGDEVLWTDESTASPVLMQYWSGLERRERNKLCLPRGSSVQ